MVERIIIAFRPAQQRHFSISGRDMMDSAGRRQVEGIERPNPRRLLATRFLPLTKKMITH
jgi:hypothetical protein